LTSGVEVGPEQETVSAGLPRRNLIGRNQIVLSNDAFENARGPREQVGFHVGPPICQRLSASLDLWLAQEIIS
jgi:hypothetical protein